MKKKLLIIGAVILALAVLVGGAYGALIWLQPFQRDCIVGYGERHPIVNDGVIPMRLREDGSFTVLQFTDTHLVHTRGHDARTLRELEYHTARLQPDLVVISGDMVEGRAARSHTLVDRRGVLEALIDIFARHEQPWAFIPGNNDHDSFLGTAHDIASFLAVHCENIIISQWNGLPGAVHIILPLVDAENYTAHNLLLIDSLGRFDTMQPEQANWLSGLLHEFPASIFLHYNTPVFTRAGLANHPRPFDDALDELFLHPNVGLVSIGHTHPDETRRATYEGTIFQIVRASGYRRGDSYPGAVLITITPNAEELYYFYDFIY